MTAQLVRLPVQVLKCCGTGKITGGYNLTEHEIPPPHLSPLAAGQSVSVQHPPQHPPGNGGVDPEQPEAVVVVLDFVYHPLANGPPDGLCVQRGAVHRPSFLQLLLLVLQGAQRLLHLGVVPSAPGGVYPPQPPDVLRPRYCPLRPGCEGGERRRGDPQK